MRFPFAGPFTGFLQALRRPGAVFSSAPPTLGRAAVDMAAVWVPLALMNAACTLARSLNLYEALRRGTFGPEVPTWFGANLEGFRDQLLTLPPAPTFGRTWPWLLLLVPLGVMGTWLHHAVWDHTGLWLLGGLKEKRGFRASLLAEAQALRVASMGTLVGLLGFVPGLGTALLLPLLLLDGYLWLFRGFALAARHGCEAWRGVAATVVHAVLLGGCVLGLVALLLVMLRVAA